MDSNLPRIPTDNSDNCIPKLLFEARQRGEITHDDWCIGVSNWVADNPGKFSPIKMVPMGDNVRNYVTGRLNGLGYDPDLGLSLGQWVYSNIQVHGENEANRSHFEWARGWCEKVGLSQKVDKLDHILGRFVYYQRNLAELQAALRVQEMDSDARRRSA